MRIHLFRIIPFFLSIFLINSYANCAPPANEKTRFCISIASFNNEKWFKKNLNALSKQKYSNWYAIYIDDCSEDDTGKLVEKWVAKHNMQDKITVIHNKERKGALANTYLAAHLAAPDDVVVIYDGDDWLNGSGVLSKYAEIYANPEVWITYGCCASYPTSEPNELCEAYPEEVQAENGFRKYPWVVSQMRTFYAGLFHLIEEEDLKFDGEFFPTAGDVAYMYPMLEMASQGHIEFVPDFHYIYNKKNIINDVKVRPKLQFNCFQEIRKRKVYTPLSSFPQQEEVRVR